MEFTIRARVGFAFANWVFDAGELTVTQHYAAETAASLTPSHSSVTSSSLEKSARIAFRLMMDQSASSP